jgi:hypothetical protein
MGGERRILKDRIEALAVERRRIEPKKRVGGEQHEGEKAEPDQALHGEHPRPERRRQVAAEQGDARAVERKDPDPQDQRALVAAPGRRDLEDQRLRRVGVAGDVDDREVGDCERPDQRAEGEREKRELAERGRPGQGYESGVAARRAPQGQRALDQREAKGQHECIVADLPDHSPVPGSVPPFQTPARLSASAASGGM